MQANYVSLDPTIAKEKRQYILDRERVFGERMLEARGGQGAQLMGALTGLTAGYWTFLLLSRQGFTILPYHRTKIGRYALVIGSFLIAKRMGTNFVGGVTNDVEQIQYLSRNKNAIIRGNMPFEKSHYKLTLGK